MCHGGEVITPAKAYNGVLLGPDLKHFLIWCRTLPLLQHRFRLSACGGGHVLPSRNSVSALCQRLIVVHRLSQQGNVSSSASLRRIMLTAVPPRRMLSPPCDFGLMRLHVNRALVSAQQTQIRKSIRIWIPSGSFWLSANPSVSSPISRIRSPHFSARMTVSRSARKCVVWPVKSHDAPVRRHIAAAHAPIQHKHQHVNSKYMFTHDHHSPASSCFGTKMTCITGVSCLNPACCRIVSRVRT